MPWLRSWALPEPAPAPDQQALVRALHAASGALARANRDAAECHLALLLDGVRGELALGVQERAFLTTHERNLRHSLQAARAAPAPPRTRLRAPATRRPPWRASWAP